VSVVEAEAEAAAYSLEELIRSPLGWSGLLRAGAIGLATVLGIVLFPDHAIWPALTVLLVMRPKAGEAVEASVLRTVGTLAGVLIAEAVVAVADGSELVIFAAFMVGAFAMVALKKVDYAVLVLFLTGSSSSRRLSSARALSPQPHSGSSPPSSERASPSSASA